jgi:IS30 family transposase
MPCYWHLSSDERTEIGILIRAGYSISAIARALGRSRSTISRQLKRNRLPTVGYSPCHGDGAYMARRQRASVLERDAALECFLVQRTHSSP